MYAMLTYAYKYSRNLAPCARRACVRACASSPRPTSMRRQVEIPRLLAAAREPVAAAREPFAAARAQRGQERMHRAAMAAAGLGISY